jgi:heme-degrading monooxygenase HmoA
LGATLYTVGVWIVRPGAEEDFVRAWEEFARWSAENHPGAGWVRLLQNEAQPNRFLSVGPWASAEAIEGWRASDGFSQRIAAIRPLLERFEPGSYIQRVSFGEPSS